MSPRGDGLVRPDATDVRGTIHLDALIHVVAPGIERQIIGDGRLIARSAPEAERVLVCVGDGAHGIGREVLEARAIGVDHRGGQAEHDERERSDDGCHPLHHALAEAPRCTMRRLLATIKLRFQHTRTYLPLLPHMPARSSKHGSATE